MTRTQVLKFLENVAGESLVRLLSHVPRKKISEPAWIRSILFIRPGGIGDAVLLAPVIQTLKHSLPGTSIDVLAESRNAEIFALCPGVDNIYRYDRPHDLMTVLQKKYDVVIDSEQWHKLSAVVARLTGAPVSIGYATNSRMKLFTVRVSYSHSDYEVISFLNLITPIKPGLSVDIQKPFLNVKSDVLLKVKSLLSVSSSKIITIFPGASIEERRWGTDNFHHVAKLLNEKGYGISIVGGKNDRKSGDQIVRGLHNAFNLCGIFSLPETAAVLKLSALLITGDSGIMHLAFALGTPTLSLFGPGIEKKWAPQGADHIVINKRIACSPCTKFGYTPKCKKGAECLNQISLEEVYKKSIYLLEGPKNIV